MKNTLVAICALLFFAGCSSSQFALYRPKNSERQWNVTAKIDHFGNKITVAINDSVVVSDSPGLFSHSFEAKGTYQGNEVKFYAVYNDGFLGIGSGWEITIYVDNEMASKIQIVKLFKILLRNLTRRSSRRNERRPPALLKSNCRRASTLRMARKGLDVY